MHTTTLMHTASQPPQPPPATTHTQAGNSHRRRCLPLPCLHELVMKHGVGIAAGGVQKLLQPLQGRHGCAARGGGQRQS